MNQSVNRPRMCKPRPGVGMELFEFVSEGETFLCLVKRRKADFYEAVMNWAERLSRETGWSKQIQATEKGTPAPGCSIDQLETITPVLCPGRLVVSRIRRLFFAEAQCHNMPIRNSQSSEELLC